MFNTLKTVFLLGTIASSLTACNTVSGVGEDVQAGGHALEHAGDNSKPRHYDNAGR